MSGLISCFVHVFIGSGLIPQAVMGGEPSPDDSIHFLVTVPRGTLHCMPLLKGMKHPRALN